MSQHFLQSAAARTLKLKDIYAAGEEKAYQTFREMRWPETAGEPICPFCGVIGAYEIKSRRKFECRDCGKQFSVTSGTILASRKMSFTDLLAAICILANAAKGVSALQLSRDIGCQHKTAYVLAHKFREAIARETSGLNVEGVCEIDGAAFGGHIRPANLKKNRIDRRLVEHQTGKRRFVITLRQRDGRTLTHVAKTEAAGVDLVASRTNENTIIHADEAAHWDALEARFPIKRINHSEAYSLNGACTNWAESYFSRLRRMVGGQHHWVSPQHLHQYAAHCAWLEDHRRESNGSIAGMIARDALAAPISRQWKRYGRRA
jgi:transposase-like protein